MYVFLVPLHQYFNQKIFSKTFQKFKRQHPSKNYDKNDLNMAFSPFDYAKNYQQILKTVNFLVASRPIFCNNNTKKRLIKFTSIFCKISILILFSKIKPYVYMPAKALILTPTSNLADYYALNAHFRKALFIANDQCIYSLLEENLKHSYIYQFYHWHQTYPFSNKT